MVLRNIESILLIEASCPAFHTQYSLAQTDYPKPGLKNSLA